MDSPLLCIRPHIITITFLQGSKQTSFSSPHRRYERSSSASSNTPSISPSDSYRRDDRTYSAISQRTSVSPPSSANIRETGLSGSYRNDEKNYSASPSISANIREIDPERPLINWCFINKCLINTNY